jgi:hypothetical protein
MKLANGIRFTDKAIANVRHADIVFTYTDQNGQVKTKPFVDIPFKNLKHTRLKGLNLRVFRNGGIYFIVRYWFQKKTKTLTLGESIPGMFGKKQVEDKLYELTDTHLNDNGHWEKDPLITEKDKTRVITDTQFTESKKKTINELIVACLKANLPKGKRAGRLRAISAQDLSRYMIGYNWRHKHLVFRDDKDGNGYITFKPNWHKRTARPQDWEDLFTRYRPGIGNITNIKLNPMKARSIYDSTLGKTIIDDLNEGIIKRYLAEKSSYGVKKGIIASLKIIWYYAKDNGYLGDKPGEDPTKDINLKKPEESKSLGSIHNDGQYQPEEIDRIISACKNLSEQYPFQAESLLFMTYSGQRREQILKLKLKDIKIITYKGEPRKVAEFPASITKKGKKDYVIITDDLQSVLDQIAKIKERPGFEKYKFIDWLFPSVRADKKRIHEPGYQLSDYTRIKDNKTCWNAVKELAQVGGARKVLRKYYNTGAFEEVGDEATKLTGHDIKATLEKHYFKQQLNKVISNADKVAKVLFRKKVS